MMTFINSDDSLASPHEIATYLGGQGWIREETVNDRFEVWATDSVSAPNEVVLPLRAEASDYTRRIENLFADLSTYLHKPITAIKQEIAQGAEDRIYFRIDGDAALSGHLPLSDTAQAYNQISKIVIASACSTIRRRSFHGRSRPKAAREMVRRLQAVVPERGSYVIPLVNDLPNLDSFHEDPTLDLNVESERTLFPRRVLGTLHSSIAGLSNLTTEDSIADGRSLTTAVLEGLSSETCAAVSKLLSTDGVDSLDIDFGWAPTRRKPTTVNHISFSADQAPRVESIGRRLRDRDTVSDEVVYGTVISLKRAPADDEGNVIVSAVIDHSLRQIRMTLDDEEYRVASQANTDRVRVVVSGELHRPASGSYQMTRVDSFKRDSATRF